ncbi:MAG: histidinol-phosphate transaminase [Syntrophomonadaceae bacterium]|jgi:histidinol-phosphate aminotransferase
MSDFIYRRARPEIFALKPYIPGKPIEEVRRELGIEDIIKIASNENPLGPSPRALEAIGKNLSQISLYPDSNCHYLRTKLSSLWGFEPDAFIIGNGSDELLKLIAETFLNKDDEVIYPEPSFAEYEFVTRIMGAKCVPVPLVDFTLDLESMLEMVNERTKIVVICNPNNPTGTMVRPAAVDRFMDRIPQDVLVVFDEAYIEYTEEKEASALKYVANGKNVIVLRTFSKIYGLAGLRIGYGVTAPEIADAIGRVREPFNVNMLAQLGSIAALDDSHHLAMSRKINEAGKEYLYKEFDQMGLQYVKTEANFIFVNTGRDCQSVFKSLLNRGIIVRTGDIFGFPTYIRVTIGTQEQNERFIDALKTVLQS